jgi:CHAD domain-containing protein
MHMDDSISKPGPRRLISLAQHHNQLSRIIARNFTAARDNYSVDGTHDFRVGIKRWRAFMVLLQAMLPGIDSKSCRKGLNRIFKAAGRVRDCHIQQELIRDARSNRQWGLSEYYNELKKSELAARARFARAAVGFNPQLLETVEAGITQAAPTVQTDVLVQSAFRRLGQGVRVLLRYDMPGGFPEGDLHSIRIQSKETRYIVEIIQTCLSHRRDLGDLNDRLRGVHQALGLWHDREVSLDRLNVFLDHSEKKKLRVPSAYAAFARELRDGKATALRAFDSAWGQFVRLIDKSGMQNSEP